MTCSCSWYGVRRRGHAYRVAIWHSTVTASSAKIACPFKFCQRAVIWTYCVVTFSHRGGNELSRSVLLLSGAAIKMCAFVSEGFDLQPLVTVRGRHGDLLDSSTSCFRRIGNGASNWIRVLRGLVLIIIRYRTELRQCWKFCT
jgi:hypothetical protein